MVNLRSRFSRATGRFSAPWDSLNTQSRAIIHLLVCLNFGITLALALTLNIWDDDAFSLSTSGKDIWYAVKHALQFEMQPPLYFVLLNLWRSLSDSAFFASLFSILCITLTLYVVAELALRFDKESHPGWITAVIALNPFVIYAAVEIRVYAFAILLSAVVTAILF